MPSRRRPPPLRAATPEGAPADAVHGRPVSRRRVLAGSAAAHLLPAPRHPDPGDAELLRQCGRVRALEAEEIVGGDERWIRALRKVSDLRPITRAGLRAKAGLALSMLPFGSARCCPDWASPDERLTWSLLHDLLAWSDGDEP